MIKYSPIELDDIQNMLDTDEKALCKLNLCAGYSVEAVSHQNDKGEYMLTFAMLTVPFSMLLLCLTIFSIVLIQTLSSHVE